MNQHLEECSQPSLDMSIHESSPSSRDVTQNTKKRRACYDDEALPSCSPNCMSKREALRVLDIAPSMMDEYGAQVQLTKKDVITAYRALIRHNHPDRSGEETTERAAYINGAKDVLMKHAR